MVEQIPAHPPGRFAYRPYQNGVGDPNDYFVASDGIEVWRHGKKVK